MPPPRWPSYHPAEYFELVAAEALVSGLPVIGFVDCPGTNRLIKNGVTGILVSPGDDRVAALAESLSLGDSELRERLGAAGGDVGPYGIEAVLERCMALLAPYGSGAEGERWASGKEPTRICTSHIESRRKPRA